MSISDVENWEGEEAVRTIDQLTGATTATPHFVPTEAGVYLFSLTVNDGNQDGLADTVAVYTTSSQQDTYHEAILGTWKWHDSLHWTFNAGGTVAVHYGDDVEETKNWSIDGSTLTITNLEDGTIDGYPHMIISISSTQFVYIYKFDPSDGGATIEEEVTLTR